MHCKLRYHLCKYISGDIFTDISTFNLRCGEVSHSCGESVNTQVNLLGHPFLVCWHRWRKIQQNKKDEDSPKESQIFSWLEPLHCCGYEAVQTSRLTLHTNSSLPQKTSLPCCVLVCHETDVANVMNAHAQCPGLPVASGTLCFRRCKGHSQWPYTRNF